MTERPILFSGPMVKAIMDGRKTQTRRIVKPPPEYEGRQSYGDSWAWKKNSGDFFSGVTTEQLTGKHGLCYPGRCPYGVPGDRLWVREQLKQPDGDPWLYAADREPVMVHEENQTAMIVWAHHKQQDYCPSIHMPRFASRITLEITGVRVERLQEITEEDAVAEGIEYIGGRFTFNGGLHQSRTARESFETLFTSINGPTAWNSNYFVWVISFKRV